MGDKLIQTENDYDKEVFNGDIGTVEQIDPEERQVVVRYDDRAVKYDFWGTGRSCPGLCSDHPQIAGIGVSSGGDPAGYATLYAAAKELDLHRHYTGQKLVVFRVACQFEREGTQTITSTAPGGTRRRTPSR